MLADRSILAGSRHSNNVAKTVVYAVLSHMMDVASALPKPMPRAWFDGICIKVVGSKEAVTEQLTMVTSKL
eukprot:8730940-Pyramimonas_sp.AAC.1